MWWLIVGLGGAIAVLGGILRRRGGRLEGQGLADHHRGPSGGGPQHQGGGMTGGGMTGA